MASQHRSRSGILEQAAACGRAAGRVTLRTPVMDDAPDIVAALADYDVVKNLSRLPYPFTIQDATDWIDGLAMREQAVDHGPFAIVTGGRLVGVIGLSERETGWELGYWLASSAWGQGLATEAARLVLERAFDDRQLTHVDAGYFVDNAASGRVLQKLGFAYTHDVARFSKARDHDVPCRMMTLPRARFMGTMTTTRTEGGTSDGG